MDERLLDSLLSLRAAEQVVIAALAIDLEMVAEAWPESHLEGRQTTRMHVSRRLGRRSFVADPWLVRGPAQDL
jgi:hypothetical protein